MEHRAPHGFGIMLGSLLGSGLWAWMLVVVTLLAGCTLKVGDKPIIGIGSDTPQVEIHQYTYASQPQPTPLGAPPTPPRAVPAPGAPIVAAPAPAPYPTVYPRGTDFSDPTLVVVRNATDFVASVSIDGRPSFELLPHQATADLHFGPGEHRIVALLTRPTSHPQHPVFRLRRELQFTVHPEGRGQRIMISQ